MLQGVCALSTLKDLWAQLRLVHVTIDLLQHVTAAPHIPTCPMPSPTLTASVSHRRTVGKSTGLSCPFAGSCKINKAQRRHCPACRLRKCLDAGMKKESESPLPPRVQTGLCPPCPTQQAQEAFPASWVMSPQCWKSAGALPLP